MRLDDILDEAWRARLELATGEGGTGLPNACYTSPEWLALENERLFARTWMYAGSIDQIATPGDVLPITIAGKPILLVRDRKGEVRAFHNVCRHRGAVLVDTPCKGAALLTCPYHAWTYGLDGRLRSRPHFDGADRHDLGGDGSGPGLVPVRLAVWHRFVFVNLDGAAPPFETHIAPLARHLSGHDLSALRYATTLTWEFRANWKLVFENYMDNYHIFAIHPKLDAFTAMRERTAFFPEGPLFWTETSFPDPEEGRGVGLPYYPGLTPELERFEGGYHLFPTACLQVWPDQLAIFQMHPMAPDHTIEEIHMFFIGEAATDEAHAAARQGVYDMWNELNGEDIDAVQWMQKGRSSPAFDGGRLSGFWDVGTQHFAKLVLETMS